MIRTAFHASPWCDISPSEVCVATQAAGLGGVVLSASLMECSSPAWRLAAANAGLRVDAIEIDSAIPAAVDAACELAASLHVRVVILRPLLTARPTAADRPLWQEIGKLAARRGQIVAIDFGANDVMDARAMSQFMTELAHPSIQLCFHLGAYASQHPFSHWEVALQRVCTQLAVVVLGDATGTLGDVSRPPLGEGTIDFLRTLEVLRPLGFNGLAVVDVRPTARSRRLPLQQLQQALQESTAHLRRCGWFDP